MIHHDSIKSIRLYTSTAGDLLLPSTSIRPRDVCLLLGRTRQRVASNCCMKQHIDTLCSLAVDSEFDKLRPVGDLRIRCALLVLRESSKPTGVSIATPYLGCEQLSIIYRWQLPIFTNCEAKVGNQLCNSMHDQDICNLP